uniref:C16orf48 homolog n=1 Tax=Lepeophtheirus salmonis TaxID=72036 RepID=C1BUH8_LEPSM|nr:C16orf48 homolog [Lepeophtheirus salmonis]
MLGLEPPSSRVDWRRQNLIELKRTQCRNRERKKAEEQLSTKRGPLKAQHLNPISPRVFEEIDIPELNSGTASVFNDVSILARRQKVDEILDDIWATLPLSDQGIYYPSRRGSNRHSRSQSRCSSSRISVNQLPFSKQSRIEVKPTRTSSRLSISTPDLAKASKEPTKITGTNYVKSNATNVSSHRKHHLSDHESLKRPEVIPSKPGAIPKYLKQRKDQWRKDAELKERSKPDPNCPPGHVLLKESSRIAQIENLESKMQSLVEEFSHLPMGRNTLRIQNRRKDIEDELRQTEESIRVLAKSKVYVPRKN